MVFLRKCESKYASAHVYRVWDENKGCYVSVAFVSYIQVAHLWCIQVPTLDGASVDLLREERPKGILYRDTVFKAF